MKRCVYNEMAGDCRTIDMDGNETKTPLEDTPRLCSWAHESTDAEKLVGMPIWVQRIALSGAYMNRDDCDNCAAKITKVD